MNLKCITLLIFCLAASFQILVAQSLIQSTGSSNNYSIIYPANFSGSIPAGTMITFQANHSTTGNATLNVNTIGAFPVLKNLDQNLTVGDIKVNHFVTVIFDGTNWQMLSVSANPTASNLINGGGTSNGVAIFNGSNSVTIDGSNLTYTRNTYTKLNVGKINIQSTSSSGDNLAIGANAGNTTMTGSNNLIFGASSGGVLSSGSDNAFFGVGSGNKNTSGSSNTFFGSGAGYNNTGGNFNTFFGSDAGINSNADYNVFLGRAAGQTNTIGTSNIAIGASADFAANNLTNAIAIGYQASAGANNTMALGGTGANAVKVGIGLSNPSRAILEQNGAINATAAIFGGNTTGVSLTNAFPGIGFNLYLAGAGWTSIAAGYGGGIELDPSTGKMHFGTSPTNAAGANIFSSRTTKVTIDNAGNLGIGTVTPSTTLHVVGSARIEGLVGPGLIEANSNGVLSISTTTGSKWSTNTAPGIHYMGGAVGINTTTPGFYLDVKGDIRATDNIRTSKDYLINGNSVLKLGLNSITSTIFVGGAGNATSDGIQNVMIGQSAGSANTTGYANNFIGYAAGVSNQTGYGNVFLGQNAGSNNTGGNVNVYIGFGAGQQQTNNVSNQVFIGYNAGNQSNSANGANTYIGQSAGAMNTTGYYNTYVGAQAGASNGTGYQNSLFGFGAGYALVGGHNNVMMGKDAGSGTNSGFENVFIGYNAAVSNAGGNRNVVIGNSADLALGNLTNAISIGYNALVSGSNQMVLGGTGANAVDVGIGTSNPTSPLVVERENDYAEGVFNTYHTGSTNYSALVLSRANGTQTTPTAVQSGNILGAFVFRGYNGSSGANGAQIVGFASENYSGAANGAGLYFSTAKNGSTAATERMRITNDGKVSIGSTSALARLFVQGETDNSSTNAFQINNSAGGVNFVINDMGNLGMGLIPASYTRLHVAPSVSGQNSMAVFSNNTHGIAIGDANARIGFNQYYNAGPRAMTAFRTSQIEMNQVEEALNFSLSAEQFPASGTAVTMNRRMSLKSDGALVIGSNNLSTPARLEVRGTNPKTTTATNSMITMATNEAVSQLEYRLGMYTDATAINRHGYIEVDDAGTKRNFVLQPNGGNVGIGITVPVYRLDVRNTSSIASDGTIYGKLISSATSGSNAAINGEIDANGSSGTFYAGWFRNNYAATGSSGIGIYAEVRTVTGPASNILTSIWGEASAANSNDNYAVYGRAGGSASNNYAISGTVTTGAASANNYGVYGYVNSPGLNSFGIFTSVAGTATNKYAAVFMGGGVGINTIPGANTQLHVAGPTGANIKMQSLSAINTAASVIGGIDFMDSRTATPQANIKVVRDGTGAANDYPTGFEFGVTADGTAGPVVTALKISNNRDVSAKGQLITSFYSSSIAATAQPGNATYTPIGFSIAAAVNSFPIYIPVGTTNLRLRIVMRNATNAYTGLIVRVNVGGVFSTLWNVGAANANTVYNSPDITIASPPTGWTTFQLEWQQTGVVAGNANYFGMAMYID